MRAMALSKGRYPDLCVVLSFHVISISNAAEAILLGFQHYLVMLGTTVIIPTALVPQMGGGNVSAKPFSNYKDYFFICVMGCI